MRVEFARRYDKYLDPSFFQHRVRSVIQVCSWLSSGIQCTYSRQGCPLK